MAVGAATAHGAVPSAADSPTGQGLQLNVAGKLADYDRRPMQGAQAGATILASDIGGSGIARIGVSVDGKRVSTHRVECQPSCPAWASDQYTYQRSRFGTGHHVVTVTAVTGVGHQVRRRISVQRQPKAATGKGNSASSLYLPSGAVPPELAQRAASNPGGAASTVLKALKSAIKGTPSGAPQPQPAFYATAANATDLDRQVATDAARFATIQGPGPALLVFDFGAARRKGKQWGVSLRSGTFFSNEQIGDALEAAASAYSANYQQGNVTIVYATSNSHIGDPKRVYKPLNVRTAAEAGRRQAQTVRHLHLYDHETAAVGGDIEPGYPNKASPKVSIALVRGASAGKGNPYYNFGTAPCSKNKCKNGWTVQDVCAITSGGGRLAVPEIYYATPTDQSQQWAAVRRKCHIQAFAGASASKLGHYEPTQSWKLLRKRGGVGVGPVVVVWPE